MVQKIFEPLVQIDAKTGEPVPWLAEGWSISPDGLKYTFKIRPGITWSDGQPLTAEDVKFTWETILDPKTQTVRKSLFDAIAGAKDRIAGRAPDTSGIKVIDPHTIEVTLTEPNCSFLTGGAAFYLTPRHVLDGQDVNTAAFNLAPTVALGPWLFKEWSKGSHVLLARNEKYWGGPDGAARGGPYLDQYVYKVVPDQTAVLNNLRVGEADLGEIAAKDRNLAAGFPEIAVTSWAGLRYTYVGFNLRRPIFQEKAVRRAMALGLDTRAIINAALDGEGQPLASPIPPNSWAGNPNIPLVPYDPAAARALLDAAGWRTGPDGIRTKDGQRLAFTLWTNTGSKAREAVATIAQQQWKEIGIEAELQFEELSALVDRVGKTLDFDVYVSGWALFPDPDPSGIWHSKAIPAPGKTGNNHVGYSNPDADRLIEQGLAVPGCAKEERRRIYHRFQEIVAEDQPYIWLFLQNTVEGYNKRLRGVDPGPFRTAAESWNAERWWIAP